MLSLSPRLHMRSDVTRAIIYPRFSRAVDDSDFVYFLHPLDALLLTFFNGHRSEEDVAKFSSAVFQIDNIAAHRYVSSFLSRPVSPGQRVKDLLAEHEGPPRNYEDMLPDLLVPRNTIDLTSKRCNIPTKFFFMPTMACATNCVYCYNDVLTGRRKPLLPLARIKEILCEARSLQIFNIVFSGGDPFCRNDIFEILETIKELGIYAQVPTKSPLNTCDIQRLLELGETIDLQVSIDAITPHILDEIVSVPGYHPRICRTLEQLASAGIPLRTNSVVTSQNVADIPKLLEFLAMLGNVRRAQLTQYTRSLYRHDDALFPDEKEIANLNHELVNLRTKFPAMDILFSGIPDEKDGNPDSRRKSFQKRPMCTAGLWGFVLLPDGKVTSCEEFCWHPKFIMGDLRVQTIMEMWTSANSSVLVQQPRGYFAGSICEECESFAACIPRLGRCVRDTMKMYGSEHDNYPDHRCPIAPPGLRIV